MRKKTEGGMNHVQSNPKPRIISKILQEKAELELERGNVASQLSAASSLLRLTCDAVIELDNDLRLTEDSPELAYMLMTLGVGILSRLHGGATLSPRCLNAPPAHSVHSVSPAIQIRLLMQIRILSQ